MAEIVASAVASDTVSRISTFLIGKCYDRKPSEKDDDDGTERLEMAHIRMEAALETSGKSWPPLTDVSLLRWRVKLKRAADECDAVLRGRKRRAMEPSSSQETERRRSFPARIAHAARSFFSSSSVNDSPGAEIRRYERFADDASEFLRFVELGGRVGRRMILDPLVGQILAGRAFQYQISQGGRRYYLASRPMGFAERGLEAGVMLRYTERGAPAKNFVLGITLRVTESTDLIGTVGQCLESLTPRLKPVADIAKQELDRVHTRSLHCFPFLASTDPVYWKIHTSETRRARPNPLCCHGGHERQDRSRVSGVMEFPEALIKMFVQRDVSVSEGSRKRRKRPSPSVAVAADLDRGDEIGSGDSTPLQLTAVFAPHASPEELPPGVDSIAVEVTGGGKRAEQAVRENVGLQELEELLLPGAMSRLCHGAAEGSAQEVFWRSGHGVAYLCVEETGTDMAVRRPRLWQV